MTGKRRVVPHRSYRFGRFLFDRRAIACCARTVRSRCRPRCWTCSRLLVARPSELVTKEDILRELWPDVAVTDNAVTQAVSELRQALGDDPVSPQYIQTVPRRGYRFIARVAVAQHGLRAIRRRTHSARARRAGRSAPSPCRISPTSPPMPTSAGWPPASPKPSPTTCGPCRTCGSSIAARCPTPCAGASVESARASGLDLLVVGSYQRRG